MALFLMIQLVFAAGFFDQRTTRGNPFDQSDLVSRGGAPQIHGHYNSGCIEGAKSLDLESRNYIVLNPQRNAFWGHPRSIDKVDEWAKWSLRKWGRKLKVMDIGLPMGGPAVPRHGSHQIGLDIDIALHLVPESFGPRDVNLLSSPEFGILDLVSTDLGHGRLQYVLDARTTAYFNRQSYQLIRHVAQDPDVQMVFVNPVIRNKLCQMAKVQQRADRQRRGDEILAPEAIPKSLRWMRKIRFVGGHTYHLHARLQKETPVDVRPYSGTDWGLGCEMNRGPNTYWLNQRVLYLSQDMVDFAPQTLLGARAKAHYCRQYPNAKLCLSKTEATESMDEQGFCFETEVFDQGTHLFNVRKCVPRSCQELIE